MSSTTSNTIIKSGWQGYFSKPAIILLFLGFAAGLPILLIFSSLSLWLREAGIDRSVVTMFGWAGLGYSFKFIWSPLVDTLKIPFLRKRLGHRRAWILLSQLSAIGAICLMAMTNPAQENLLNLMALGAVWLGFSSATQDIVIDAYRIEAADKELQTVLSAMYVAGYRIGMIVAGAGALYLADFFGSTETSYSYLAWQKTYLMMALIMLVAVITTLVADEPNSRFASNQEAIKAKRNEKAILGALLAVLPLALFGLYYLIIKLLVDVFGLEIGVFDGLTALAGYYTALLLALTPFIMIYLVLQQPRIVAQVPLLDEQSSNQNQDYVRLVALFFISVIGFVVVFRIIGTVLPESSDPAVGFFWQSLRLITAGAVAIGIGYFLTLVGVAKKQVVMRAWVEPIADFFGRYGKQAILLLLLIGLYRISDIVAGVISNVFYQDMGFSKTDIANAVKLVGVIVTILGGFIGGWLALKMKIINAMMIGAVLACATNLLFIALYHNPQLYMMYLAVMLDNLAAGLASAVFVAFLSSLTSIRFTAVQYALLSSLMTLFPKVLGGYSGSIVDATSYGTFFMITFLIGLPVLLLIVLVDKNIKLDEPKIGQQ